MTGGPAAPAAAMGPAPPDDRAGHQTVPAPASTAGFTGRARDMPVHEHLAPGEPGSGENGDARKRDDAWAAFYRAEYPLLVRRLMYTGASVADAADAVQNAFMELYTYQGTVESPRAWLRTVAMRSMARQSARHDVLLRVSEARCDQLPHAHASDPEVVAEQQAVLDALRRLPVRQRQVIALLYDGFSAVETAQVLGISQAAVRSNLARARLHLRESLTRPGPAFDAPRTRLLL